MAEEPPSKERDQEELKNYGNVVFIKISGFLGATGTVQKPVGGVDGIAETVSLPLASRPPKPYNLRPGLRLNA